MIELSHLTKRFGRRAALQDVSLTVKPGEMVGLLGHNGAGKSTTLGILLGQVHADAGTAAINGRDVGSERAGALASTGAIFESPRFYDYLSGWRNLLIYTAYSARVPKSQMEEAVRVVGLGTRIHDRVGTYSQGMRQRLGLVQALLPQNKVLLLDEPTNGLDPEGIHEMRGLIQDLNRERGLTVLFCSHLLSEVEQLCDHVAILHRGRKIFDGRWAELTGEQCRVHLEVENWDKAAPLLGSSLIQPGLVTLASEAEVPDLVHRLVAQGVRIRAIHPVKRSLEEIYLQMTQNHE